MIDTDPVLIVRDVLQTGWDGTTTALSSPPDIHTGWYDYGAGGPQVTVTNPNEFSLGGGYTGQSAGTGDGRPAQVRVGTVLVNGWSGSRDDLASAGPGGDQLNPKQVAYELGREVHRVIQANADGGDHLNSLGADTVMGVAETDEPEVVFRREVTVRYTYVDIPPA